MGGPCSHRAAGTQVPVLLAITGIAEAESLARYGRHRCSKGVLRARWRAENTPVSGTGLALPAAGGVSDETVAFALNLIDSSGADAITAAYARITALPQAP